MLYLKFLVSISVLLINHNKYCINVFVLPCSTQVNLVLWILNHLAQILDHTRKGSLEEPAVCTDVRVEQLRLG